MIAKRLRQFLPFVLPLLVLATPMPAACADAPAVPPAFERLVPRSFADGLRLVEIRERCTGCTGCAAARAVGIALDTPDGPARKEMVSVAAGVTAMYAYAGSGYFANVKIERSAPGSYAHDKAVVLDALAHADAAARAGVAAYLRTHPEQKDRLDRIAAGRDYVELERGRHQGVEYAVLTQNLLVEGPRAMPAMLHVFVPERDLIVTAYLMTQQASTLATVDAFRRAQRSFIEGYIDFVSAK